MPASSIPSATPRKKRNRFSEKIRRYFLAGILVTGPIALTFYVAWIFVRFVDGLVNSVIPEQYHPERYLPFNPPGLGLLVAVIGLTLIGALTAGYLGRMLLRMSDRIMARMPVIRSIHGATKQIFETVLAKQSNTFREVVLVEFPHRGAWTIAFITGKTEGEIKSFLSQGEEMVTVYVPTTPNPTSGYLLFVKRSETILLSMTVEEAIKFVISGGIVAPPDRNAPVAAV